MGKAPAFQFYAAEYLADENVQLLSLEQEGAYIRLLAYCWREGSIPAEPLKLSRLCKGCDVEMLAGVLALFRPSELDGRLSHKWLDDEREKHESYRLKQAANGARGGRPSKHNPSQSETKGFGLLGVSQNEPKKRSSSAFASSASSSTENKKQKTSLAKREVDARHKEFRDLASHYWNHKNPSIQMPWDASEAKQLSSLLSANPLLSADDFTALLHRRSKSTVNHAERPRSWLPRITDYAGGPLNEFNKPIGEKDGRFMSKTERSADAAGAAIEAIENRGNAERVGCTSAGLVIDARISSVRDGSSAL